MIRGWLCIEPAPESPVTIQAGMDHAASVACARVWYRGDACELEQLYKQLGDGAGRTRFWAAAPVGEPIRKLHSGLPALMADTLAYLVKADLDEVAFRDGTGKADWDALVKGGLDLAELTGDAVVQALVTGDGAFKISVDTQVSPHPIVEFIPADHMEYETRRGYVTGLHFYSAYRARGKSCRLRETYRPGSVTYALFDGTREVPLSTVEELADLRPVRFDDSFTMAVPLCVYKSLRFPGRGKSIFETKTDAFDALDEVLSQWMDALRAGRVQKYLPEDLIPRDNRTGELLPVNSFGTSFIKLAPRMGEDARASQIDTVQPEIRYEAFLSTYTAALDLCLQGLMSPATLGIDVGRMSSAEAQREKKDVTGVTRNAITAALGKALPRLVCAVLMTWDVMREKPPGRYEPTVAFGEYGAPDFDSRVETVAKAAVANVMSVQAQVDELWGNSKDEAWKRAEVQRIEREKAYGEELFPGSGDEPP